MLNQVLSRYSNTVTEPTNTKKQKRGTNYNTTYTTDLTSQRYSINSSDSFIQFILHSSKLSQKLHSIHHTKQYNNNIKSNQKGASSNQHNSSTAYIKLPRFHTSLSVNGVAVAAAQMSFGHFGAL